MLVLDHSYSIHTYQSLKISTGLGWLEPKKIREEREAAATLSKETLLLLYPEFLSKVQLSMSAILSGSPLLTVISGSNCMEKGYVFTLTVYISYSIAQIMSHYNNTRGGSPMKYTTS